MHFLAFLLQSPEVQGTIGHQAEVQRIHFPPCRPHPCLTVQI